jgi:hypothetical protein
MRLPSRRKIRPALLLEAARCCTVVLIAVLGTLNRANATPVIDQQQPIIDASVGGLAIGGGSAQKLAQVVTAGISGFLTEVRFPVACDAGSNLVVEIQGVAGGVPNGVILTSQTILGASLPTFVPSPPSFRSLVLSAPVSFTAGNQFAIVLRSAGSCGVFRGPAGNPYQGGNLYFDALPNPPGWVCVCSFPGDRFDLPFQTLVEPDCAPPVISAASASPSTLWPPNHRMVDVAVDYTVASNCPTSCTLNVVSNEAPNGIGDGNMMPDWIVVDRQSVWLRAERAGNGGGRVYTATITCTNAAGQFSSQSVTVTVPHNRSK